MNGDTFLAPSAPGVAYSFPNVIILAKIGLFVRTAFAPAGKERKRPCGPLIENGSAQTARKGPWTLFFVTSVI